MLFIPASNFVRLLGPWQVVFDGHGLEPSPTVKKNCLSMVRGTLAGYLALAKLRNDRVKLDTKFVALIGGKDGLSKGSFVVFLAWLKGWFGKWSYVRIPAVVELSKVPKPVKYGLAVMRNVALGW